MKATRLSVALVLGGLMMLMFLPAHASGGTCWKYWNADERMAKKINKARSNSGKTKLALDPHLSKVARKHTRSMAKSGVMTHSSNLGAKVTRWKALGENVGYGSNVKNLHNMFMGSDGHRANILNSSFRYVGVGTVRKNGYMWTTVVFESKKNPGTTLPMPSC